MNPALAVLPQEIRERAFNAFITYRVGARGIRAFLSGHYCCPLGAINIALGICDNNNDFAPGKNGYVPENAVIESYLLDFAGYGVKKSHRAYLDEFITQNDAGGFSNSHDLAIAMGVKDIAPEPAATHE